MTPDEFHTVPIYFTNSEVEAHALAAALRDDGINAVVEGTLMLGLRAEVPAQARIVVAANDEARAKAAVERLKAELRNIDWDTVDVGDPEDNITPDNRCLSCNYDLEGISAHVRRCPECGTLFTGRANDAS